MSDHRARFDFEVLFANGGHLTAQAFRLDLPTGTEDEAAIGRLLIRHLGLALVRSVLITNLAIVQEQHRGSRGTTPVTAGSGRRIVDLSHRIRSGMTTYPGLPAPEITPYLTRESSRARYAPGTEFAMDVITMIGNTGTYLDSPYHRSADGADLAGLDLATLVDLPAQVFHLTDTWSADDRGIRAETLADRELRGAAVLLHTGWDRHFGTSAYGRSAPFLTGEAAEALVAAGVALVGIDSVNIDDTESGGARPAHSVLLAGGVHVLEHLRGLAGLPARGARFTAVPPAVEGFGTFPVRAYATVPREA